MFQIPGRKYISQILDLVQLWQIQILDHFEGMNFSVPLKGMSRPLHFVKMTRFGVVHLENYSLVRVEMNILQTHYSYFPESNYRMVRDQYFVRKHASGDYRWRYRDTCWIDQVVSLLIDRSDRTLTRRAVIVCRIQGAQVVRLKGVEMV